MRNLPILKTKRLILRSFQQTDIEAVYKIFSDPIVNTYLPWFPLQSRDEAKIFLEERFLNNQDGGYHYAICLQEEPIGYIQMSGDESHDFGYGLQKEYWHQGIVSEAGHALIEQLKKDHIPYITATHDIKNIYSGSVMQKLGMVYKYTYQEYWQPKNIMVTFRMYQMNFDYQSLTYTKYWDMYPVHYIEKDLNSNLVK